MKIYDVCNDYSLSLCKNQQQQTEGYTWKPRTITTPKGTFKVKLGWHKGYGELHYLLADTDVNLEDVPWD